MKARLFASVVATGLLLFAVSSPALGRSRDALGGDPTIELTYLRGTDRFDTAMRICRAMFPGALPPGSGVVLAPGETFPEALCGAPLAAAYGGPVLLTPSIGINSGIVAEIQRLQPQDVLCVGLSDGVVAEVQTALGPGITVTSLSGTDIYEMSYNVAMALGARVGDMSEVTAIVTIGTRFPDAIGVSPWPAPRVAHPPDREGGWLPAERVRGPSTRGVGYHQGPQSGHLRGSACVGRGPCQPVRGRPLLHQPQCGRLGPS